MTATTTPTLTDRYVWAAARTVPEAQRAEFGRELRERIGDATDALVQTGRAPADAERMALVELGDPAALLNSAGSTRSVNVRLAILCDALYSAEHEYG